MPTQLQLQWPRLCAVTVLRVGGKESRPICASFLAMQCWKHGADWMGGGFSVEGCGMYKHPETPQPRQRGPTGPLHASQRVCMCACVHACVMHSQRQATYGKGKQHVCREKVLLHQGLGEGCRHKERSLLKCTRMLYRKSFHEVCINKIKRQSPVQVYFMVSACSQDPVARAVRASTSICSVYRLEWLQLCQPIASQQKQFLQFGLMAAHCVYFTSEQFILTYSLYVLA